MSIEIWYRNDEYHWKMYDGPDGIDEYTGKGSCLGEVFEQILDAKLKNRMRY